MWKAAKWGLVSLVVALAIALSGVIGFTINGPEPGAAPGQGNVRSTQGFGVLDEIYRVLGEDFVDPSAVDQGSLRRGAIDGVMEALGDPHTMYISPEDYGAGVDIISGTFEGIGATVDQDPTTGEIVIVAPFRGSPAERAGIIPGDAILEVDGEQTAGWSVADAVQRIRGDQGTKVVLKVRHPDGAEETVTITRAEIEVQTVFSHDLQDESGNPVTDIAYIQLQQFTERTIDQLRDQLNKVSENGSKGLILDLRRNPGGSLDATVAVADMFLDGGVVLTQVDRDGDRTDYNAKPGGEATEIPIVVLVSKGSASGSEVLAGALRDHGRAKLVGEQTFGKGSVNHLRELSDGGALYVTIARWLTPNGEQIEGVGLRPDIEVATTDQELITGAGPQLYAAINYLHGELQASR